MTNVSTTDAEEDYEYDISESLDQYDWAELIPAVVVYAIVFILGICGNVLIIFTIARYRRFKNFTNIFLASLSSADLLLVIICIPVNVAKLFSYTWTFGVFLCKFVHYMQNVSAVCSVLTLTAMSIERYYAIVHPMRAQYLCTLSQARRVITGIWIASFFLASPILWIQIHLPVGERVPAYWCVRDWERPLSWQIYELYMLFLILIIPLAIMAGAYCTIAREIWRVTYLRSAMINEPATTRTSFPELTVAEERPTSVSVETGGPFSVTRVTDRVVPADDPLALSKEDEPSSTETHRMNMKDDGEAVNGNSAWGPCCMSQSVGTLQRRQAHQLLTNGRSSTPSHRLQTDHSIARKVVKMLVAVVVLFTICWSPYLIDNVLMSFHLLPVARTGSLKHMRIAFHLLSYINSCCNPFVYGFMSRNFRRGFKAAVRSLRPDPGCCCSYLAVCCFCRRRPARPRKRSVYKFSHSSINNMRIVTQIQAQHHLGYVRSTIESTAAPYVSSVMEVSCFPETT